MGNSKKENFFTLIRKRIYSLLNQKAYDIFMITVIILSIIPLTLKESNYTLDQIERICTLIFILDYILRWSTADYAAKNKKISAIFLYPVTPMAIVDLVSILPSLTMFNSGFRLFKIFRLIRSLRVIRVVKAVRYTKAVDLIINVFTKQKEALITISGIAITYVFVSALIIFNVEPDTFNNFFDAIYWATVSLTTVGYGDIYPVTIIGRIVTMVSSVFGIAIVALPAGIITAGIMDELKKDE